MYILVFGRPKRYSFRFVCWIHDLSHAQTHTIHGTCKIYNIHLPLENNQMYVPVPVNVSKYMYATWILWQNAEYLSTCCYLQETTSDSSALKKCTKTTWCPSCPVVLLQPRLVHLEKWPERYSRSAVYALVKE